MKIGNVVLKYLACAAAVSFCATASAQSLYRCQVGGGIVYSETPCGANAQRRQLDGQAPSAEDAEAARRRAALDKIDGKVIDAQYRAKEAQRAIHAAQQDVERAAKKRRCEQYLAKAEEAKRMKDVYLTAPYKNAEEAKRKAAEDAHFSECYASNGR